MGLQEAAIVMMATIIIGVIIIALPMDLLPHMKPKTFGYVFWNTILGIGMIFIFAPILILVLYFLKFWAGLFLKALAILF